MAAGSGDLKSAAIPNPRASGETPSRFSDVTIMIWHQSCGVTPESIRRVFMAKGSVAISVERCKGCGFCVEFCPTHVLALSSAFNSKGYHPPNVVDGQKCSGCDLCGMYCPDFAIYGVRNAR